VFGGFFLNARWESGGPAPATLKSEGTDGLLQENG
jgi:hypothetical protein